MSTIEEGDWGVLHMNDDHLSIIRITKEGRAKLRAPGAGHKGPSLAGLIGKRWNEKIGWDADAQAFIPFQEAGSDEVCPVVALVDKVVKKTEGMDAGGDNRKLVDKNESQTLTPEEVIEMKKKGGGLSVVEALVTNSKTFGDKTKFSQEKYIKKKSKKHEFWLRVRKPSLELIFTSALMKKPEKLMHMRFDTLSQMLSLANVASGNNTIVVDGITGVLTAATVMRQGGCGRIYNLCGTAGRGVNTSMVYEWLGLTEQAASSLVNFEYMKDFADELRAAPTTPFGAEQDVKAEDVRDYRTKMRSDSVAHHMRAHRGADCVVIGSGHDPVNAFLQLMPLMGGSCTFCVYSRYIQPLYDLYGTLRTEMIAVNIQLSETWFREYQVLPDRTHPHVAMSATGGYILSGTIVENPHPRSFWSVTDSFSDARNKRNVFAEGEEGEAEEQYASRPPPAKRTKRTKEW